MLASVGRLVDVEWGDVQGPDQVGVDRGRPDRGEPRPCGQGRPFAEAVVVDAEDEDGLGRSLRPDLGVDVGCDRAGVLVSGVGDHGSHDPTIVRAMPRRQGTGPTGVGEARLDLTG